MYKVNQQIILLIKTGFLFGMPLLCSFIISSLANYRPLCVGLLFFTFYANYFYPDRIAFEDDKVHIKIFLRNEWLVYNKSEVRIEQGKQCLYLIVQEKQRYRLSMKKLSRNLYEELCNLHKCKV